MDIKDEAEPTQEPTQPNFKWERKTEFHINTQMRQLVTLVKTVTEGEIARLHRKLEKLTYGS